METIKYIDKIREKIKNYNKQGKKIGFVPTMGALHDGHLSLIRQSLAENDITVASIFVNPIQFNNNEDLKNYPRPVESDLKKLGQAGCDIAFIPDENEIYPVPENRTFDFGQLDKVMEGKHRPGHFTGVATVVNRLFRIIEPHRAYFGEKDYQQLLIIKSLVKQLNLPVGITGCPIVREADGLAMSSRNALLEPVHRKNAGIIRKSLLEAAEMIKNEPVPYVIKAVTDEINKVPGFRVEYFEIADINTLQNIDKIAHGETAIGCIAVFAGKIRLIDNIKF